jgi:hypothetical protein
MIDGCTYLMSDRLGMSLLGPKDISFNTGRGVLIYILILYYPLLLHTVFEEVRFGIMCILSSQC